MVCSADLPSLRYQFTLYLDLYISKHYMDCLYRGLLDMEINHFRPFQQGEGKTSLIGASPGCNDRLQHDPEHRHKCRPIPSITPAIAHSTYERVRRTVLGLLALAATIQGRVAVRPGASPSRTIVA